MVFTPQSCTLSLVQNNTYQISLSFSNDLKQQAILHERLTALSEPSANSHPLMIDKTVVYFKKKKYLDRCFKLMDFPAKMAKVIHQFLATYSHAIELCNFLNHSACLNMSKKRIEQIQKQKEECTQDDYNSVMAFRAQLKDYVGQFGKSLPELKQQLENYLDTEVNPLIERIKRVVHKLPRDLAIAAAVAKGRAYSVGMKAIIQLESRQQLIPIPKGRNLLFFMQDQGCVLKQMSRTSRIEETCIDDLFNLSMPFGVVPNFTFKMLASHRVGHKILSDSHYKWSYLVAACTPLFREAIAARFKSQDQLDLWNKMRLGYDKPEQLALNFERYNECILEVFDGAWKRMSFKQFKNALFRGEFDATTNVKLSNETLVYPIERILTGNLLRALIYDELAEIHTRTLFVPIINDEQVYEKMSKQMWEYHDEFEWITVTHKKLQYLWITREINEKTEVRPKGATDCTTILKNGPLFGTLNTRWSLFFPEPRLENTNVIQPFLNTTAKAYVPHMVLLNELDQTNPFTVNILNRLDDESQLIALFTAEFQFLDLHGGNLGISLNAGEDYDKYSPLDFFHGNRVLKFKNLAFDYLNGDILSTDLIGFRLPGEDCKYYMMKEIPKLIKCIEATWHLQLFDTEFCLAETNIAHTYTLNRDSETQSASKGHLIPIRNDLLATHWRDKPIKPHILRQWMDEQRIQRVRDWVNQADAPIRRFLPSSFVKAMDKKINSFIDSAVYSLSHQIANNVDCSHKDIRRTFSTDFAGKDFPDIFWEVMSKGLANKADGYFSDLQNDEMKRRRVALQLFPRLTFRQRKALFERQDRAITYLRYVNQMQSTFTTPEKVELLKTILAAPEMPFTLFDRERLMNEFNAALNSNIGVDFFFDSVKTIVQPTFFNFCKSMYPLLADAYYLIDFYKCSFVSSGRKIGDYTTPLERYIEMGKVDKDCSIKKLALHLEEKIHEADKEFEAYFGNFVTK